MHGGGARPRRTRCLAAHPNRTPAVLENEGGHRASKASSDGLLCLADIEAHHKTRIGDDDPKLIGGTVA
jgi:hypothetical protein